MKPLSELTTGEAKRIAGVVFDLDDTVLDHGALGEEAYASLFRLREAGLRLLACTGRPAGWGEVIARQWPIDAVVVENGAVAFVVEPASGPGPRRVVASDALPPAERRARRGELLRFADEIIARFPETGLADDNDARRSDVTLDVGEHRRVDAADVRAITALARERGVRTLVSSIHLHLTREADDKASGTIRLLVERFGEDATGARRALRVRGGQRQRRGGVRGVRADLRGAERGRAREPPDGATPVRGERAHGPGLRRDRGEARRASGAEGLRRRGAEAQRG